MGDDLLKSVSQWWQDNVTGPLFGHKWVTLKSGTTVKLDQDGRVVAGGPANWQGVHVRDLPTLSKQIRELESTDCEALSACRKCGATFPHKEAGARALLEANPELQQYLQDNWGSDSQAFRNWHNAGRRGTKPQLGDGDGRFDALNERWEMKGARRVSSWLEAVYVTVPRSRKWDDFEDRIPVLEEATGLSLRLPEDAEKRRLSKLSAQECREGLDARIDELVGRARAARLAADPGGEVPF